jgi:hypothetical protein
MMRTPWRRQPVEIRKKKDAPSMSDGIDVWQAFWSSSSAISAILFGAVLIAFSVLTKRSSTPQKLPSESQVFGVLVAYATVALIGLLVLMPMFSPKRLGALVAFLCAMLVLGTSWQIISARSDSAFSILHWGRLAPWLCYVILLWASLKLMRGGMHSINWLAIGCLLLLMTSGALSIDLVRRIGD